MRLFLLALLLPNLALAATRFEPSAKSVDCYDYFELKITPGTPPSGNPFADALDAGDWAYWLEEK